MERLLACESADSWVFSPHPEERTLGNIAIFNDHPPGNCDALSYLRTSAMLECASGIVTCVGN